MAKTEKCKKEEQNPITHDGAVHCAVHVNYNLTCVSIWPRNSLSTIGIDDDDEHFDNGIKSKSHLEWWL